MILTSFISDKLRSAQGIAQIKWRFLLRDEPLSTKNPRRAEAIQLTSDEHFDPALEVLDGAETSHAIAAKGFVGRWLVAEPRFALIRFQFGFPVGG